MNAADRQEYAKAITGLDSMIARFSDEALKDDNAFESVTAPLVGQVGAVGKALLLLCNLLLDVTADRQPPTAPSLSACMLCPRPATRLAGDWEVCDTCYEGITQPDAALDETWADVLENVLGGEP